MQTAPVNSKLASLSDMAKVLNSAVTTVSHWFVISSTNSLETQRFPLVLTVGNRKRAIFEDTTTNIIILKLLLLGQKPT